jgi:transcriptional regulator with XRE-family HTH domain
MKDKINYKETLRLIGLRVQLFRKQKHITQEELASRINKSKDTVSNIERGLAFARIETLIDICNELEIELKDLFDLPILNDITTAKALKIKEILSVLAIANEEKIDKYLEMLKLMS